MKKIGIVFCLLIVLVPLGWAGATYSFSSKTEPVVDQLLETANETTNAQWSMVRFEKTDYKKGFVSSTATTAISPSGKDVAEDDKFFLKHTIYHGPLAITPDGTKMCAAYTISVIDWSKMEKEDADEMKSAFGGDEPLTIITTQNMDSSQDIEIKMAPLAYSSDEASAEYGGMTGTVKINADQTEFSGDFNSTAVELKFPEGDDSMKMHPSTADFSYTKGKDLKANLTLGAIDGIIQGGVMNLGETVGKVDVKDDSHFKTGLKFGNFEMISPKEEEFMLKADGLIFTADYSRIDEESLLMVGKGEVVAPSMKMDAEGMKMEFSDFRIGAETGLVANKLFAQMKYGFGGIIVDGLGMAEAAEFQEMLKNGASVGFGIRGVDRQVVENIYKVINEIDTDAKDQAAMIDSLSPKLAEAFSNDLLNFFQPGLEIFYDVAMGEKSKGMEANLSLKMKGNKRLEELKTGREIANAIEGSLTAEMSKSFLVDEMMQMMVQEYVQQGMVKEKPDQSGYEFKSELKYGAISIGGEVTPLLESFGPMLDEPIPWEEFKSGVNEGVNEAIQNAKEESEQDADEVEAADAE